MVLLSGPTGAGKSLFLRTLADLDPSDDDTGTVELDGVERGALRACDWRRRVLYLHQNPARPPGTVRQDLERIRALAGTEAATIDDVLAEVGLEDSRDVERLSGGESQLLALARAFLIAPRVFLLDEATAHLDETAGARAEAALLRRREAGAGLLWVSHDAGLAGRVGARVEAFP